MKAYSLCLEIIINENQNLPFATKIYLLKVPLNVSVVKQDLLYRKQFLKMK